MTKDPTTAGGGTEGLREDLARTLFVSLCPYADAESAVRLWDAPACHGYRSTTLRFADALLAGPLARASAEQARVEAELAEKARENDYLRASLANSGGPCAYCKLPREDWAKCASGFPGCARADDANLCQHVGAWLGYGERVSVLEEALEPFAKAGELLPPRDPGDWDMCVYRPAAGREYELTGDHLRAARAALRDPQPMPEAPDAP